MRARISTASPRNWSFPPTICMFTSIRGRYSSCDGSSTCTCTSWGSKRGRRSNCSRAARRTTTSRRFAATQTKSREAEAALRFGSASSGNFFFWNFPFPQKVFLSSRSVRRMFEKPHDNQPFTRRSAEHSFLRSLFLSLAFFSDPSVPFVVPGRARDFGTGTARRRDFLHATPRAPVLRTDGECTCDSSELTGSNRVKTLVSRPRAVGRRHRRDVTAFARVARLLRFRRTSQRPTFRPPSSLPADYIRTRPARPGFFYWGITDKSRPVLQKGPSFRRVPAARTHGARTALPSRAVR